VFWTADSTLKANGAGLAAPTLDDSVVRAASTPPSAPNALSVFAGALSTATLSKTLFFDQDRSSGPAYDNYIAGAAYDRDLWTLGFGFELAGEIGIADRVGHYRQCCNPIVTTSSLVQATEIWTGLQLRYAGVVLFDRVRIGGSVTLGLSAVTNSIGAEEQRQIQGPGDAGLLYYFAPELTFSTRDLQNIEFYLRTQHRSGGKELSVLPTLGNMAEGYNATVVGIRYRY
jgi:hypothetical protein